MRTSNKYALAMSIKYGEGWDQGLFKRTENNPPAPLIIDNGTEHKAQVYDKITRTGGTAQQREEVLKILRELKTATDNEIAKELKIVPSTVAARRNELIERGKVLPCLDAYGMKIKKRDSRTGQSNIIWKAV